MNKVILIGRATKDIELKVTQSGKYIATFSLAVKRTFKNADGEYESDFFTCVTFNKLAEIVSKNVGKGDLIAVEGTLQTRHYTDKYGNNRSATEIMADNVNFLQPKKKEEATVPQMTELQTDPFDDLPF